MPHAVLKLTPGVNTNETPALNQTGVSTCNLVRYMYDPQYGGLLQKLGGWSKFYGSTMPAIVRALVAWQDLNAIQHLAYGTQNIGSTGAAQLGVITSGSIRNITPQSTTDNIAPVVSVTAGSAVVTITDTTVQNLTNLDSVYIQTQIYIGGLILYGVYQTTYISETQYQIQAVDILGNPDPATFTSTTPALPTFFTISGTTQVVVTLPGNGYSVGDTFPILVSTSVGGVTLYGNYIVEAISNSSTFIIYAATAATSTATVTLNGGNARYLYNLTPSPAGVATGYGQSAYGFGPYGGGVPQSAAGTNIAATDWSLDYWGDVLLASPINGTLNQPIYQWDPLSGSLVASAIPQAPAVNDGFFVAMPQRQVVAWGSTVTGIQDPLLITWCDVNNFNQWIPLVTNQAGSYRLPRGSRIVSGLQGPNQGYIWTDIATWMMQYIGPPYVYSFNQIGSGCGLIGRKAAGVFNGIIYWMGFSQFFILTPASAAGGGVLAPLPCPVWDIAFQDLDRSNVQKIRMAVNSLFNEVAWYFPTISSGGEVAAYIKYNTELQAWDYGSLGRSAWIDQSVLGQPIGADPSSLYLYQHETSNDADGAAMNSYFQTGFATIGDGENMTFIDQVWPDMKYGQYGQAQNATLSLTFTGANYPNQVTTTYGPYTYTQASTYITPRVRNRLLSLTIGSSDIGSFWRIGAVRYRYQGDGRF